ncbi:MAG: FG-GAP-like repeat-containing protein [Candidatus Binatia bacterium]
MAVIDVSTVSGRICGLGAALLLASGVAVAQPGIFSTGIPASLAGSYGEALPILVLADVTSLAGPPDGIPDLITALATATPNVTVMIGNGDGTFSSSVSTSIGRIPTALALGDFNGDNAADLVVASGNDVAFLQGNNDGTFKSPVVVAAVGATALAAVDVDHDGHLDLVVVNDSGVTVFLGDGKGAFGPGIGTCVTGANAGHACSVDTQAVDCPGSICVSVALNPGGSAIAVADFNVHGNVDLAVTNSNTGTVAVLVGDGNGHFAVSETLSENSVTKEPVGIAVGDVNGDGHLDIVVVDKGSDDIAVFKGLSGGKFQSPVFFATGPANSQPDGIALLDANQDGKLDVAVSNYITSDVSVLLGDGTGSFAAPRAFVSDQEPLALVAGDVNGDKIPDLVALNQGYQGPDAVVLLGQGDGSFRGVENVIVEDNPTAVVAGDLDNHAQCDLIVAHSSGTVLVRRALTGGGFATAEALQSHGDAVAIGRGDFNGDGWLDIVAVNKSTSDVSVFLGRREGFPPLPQKTPAVPQNYPVGDGASALAVADWNGDGRPDLAVARAPLAAPGVVSILLAKPDGSFGAAASVTVDVNPMALDVGDFNNDGKLDLAVANSVLTTAHLASAITATATVLTLTDASALPSSGKLQIDSELITYTGKSENQLTGLVRGTDGTTAAVHNGASVASMASGLSILFGNGDGTFHAAAHVSVPLQYVTAIAVGDFDNDGNDDIAVAQSSPVGGVSVLYGSGQGSFTAGLMPLSVGNPSALAARDLNGDLIPDLVVTDQVANAVVGFLSLGTLRRFQAVGGVTVARRPTSIVAADFDGDGRYDAAAGDSFVADVSVLTNISATHTPILRGDGNGDHKVSAADVVAVMRKLGDGASTRVEQVGRGTYAAKPGADANGDGVVTGQDIFAIAYRLFPGI